MIFVPLSLFAPLSLLFAIIYMIRMRDMQGRSNQVFVGLVCLYALQSLLLTLRWGYGITDLRLLIALLAPTLPVCAYLAYLSLAQALQTKMLWPLWVVLGNWLVLLTLPGIADLAILVTYLGFGAAILRAASHGDDATALVRINQQVSARNAMMLTGAALIASAAADLFVIADFMRTGGQHVGFTISLLQTGFLFVTALAATLGQSDASDDQPEALPQAASVATPLDAKIMDDLRRLFDRDRLHQDTDLNLRRLARKLGLPDRSVSHAINRTEGISVSQFVNGFRIKDACTLLKETDQSILQISLAAGFLTKSNFNREFVRVTGQTPSQWRTQNS